MQELTDIITPELHELRRRFVAAGRDIRLVGGCVRDLLAGVTPKDIDLCTDATPGEQMLIYGHSITFYETGLQHGTLTVNLGGNQLYEITSLRTETNHDGRHAEVAWTRDWEADLSRRDLTVNAMSMSFDGTLYDPFQGAQDLLKKRVRFVGDPDERMKEDYLRILRFFRFHARINGSVYLENDEVGAIIRNHGGLRTISKERVWVELAKIISGPVGPSMLAHMWFLGVNDAIGVPMGDMDALQIAHDHTRNPVSLMAAYLGDRADYTLATLRASTAERQLARFIGENVKKPLKLSDYKHLLAVTKAPRQHVVELALVRWDEVAADFARDWEIPIFPVDGNDIIAMGIPVGPRIGHFMDYLKGSWASWDYSISKDELLALIEV